jgi:DNA invertase Pin-like site-specific DNA recombinase
MKIIAYYRVSTDKQGINGLGMEGQRNDVVRAFGQPFMEFCEVESGKKNNRPKLHEAILACKEHDATLVIAKIDRLSRNVAFIANLMESKIRFKAADMPNIDNFTIHILSAVAEKERQAISIRVKTALSVLKEKGVKLGNPNAKEQILENRSKRVYSKPDPSKVEIIKTLKSSGMPMDKIQESAKHIFGRSLSKVTLYSYINNH